MTKQFMLMLGARFCWTGCAPTRQALRSSSILAVARSYVQLGGRSMARLPAAALSAALHSYPPCPCPIPICSDSVRALAKAKAPAAEVAAACQGIPSEEAQQAGASGRPKEMLAALSAFQAEIAGLAAAGAPPGEVLAACDR